MGVFVQTTRSVRRRSAPMPQSRAVSCTRMSTTQLKHAARRRSAVDCAGYAHMTRQLRTLAGGRLVVQLTGGYDVRSAGPPAAAVLRAMGDGHEREAGDGDGAPARARPGQSVARPAKPPFASRSAFASAPNASVETAAHPIVGGKST